MKITDLTLWQAFTTVANEGNFTKAAIKLEMNPPNLTKRISTLEAMLGTRLFNRTTRSLSLTSEGEDLLPKIVALLDLARETESQLESSEKLSGTIKMTCTLEFAEQWLMKVITDFQKVHPLVKFDLDASDRLIDLIKEQKDLAIRIQEPKGADFVFRPLVDNQLVLCAAPRYLRQAGEIVHPDDLRNHAFAFLSVHRQLRFKKSKRALIEYAGMNQVICENGLILTKLALLGGGIVLRAKWAVDSHLKSGELVQVLDKYPIEDFRKIYLVIPQRRYLNARVRAFADFVTKRSQVD